jgi:hypothetical protein
MKQQQGNYPYSLLACGINPRIQKKKKNNNTFISFAPFEPNLWFTLHKSLLIRSFASGDSFASSGNFKWVLQFTICIKQGRMATSRQKNFFCFPTKLFFLLLLGEEGVFPHEIKQKFIKWQYFSACI